MGGCGGAARRSGGRLGGDDRTLVPLSSMASPSESAREPKSEGGDGRPLPAHTYIRKGGKAAMEHACLRTKGPPRSRARAQARCAPRGRAEVHGSSRRRAPYTRENAGSCRILLNCTGIKQPFNRYGKSRCSGAPKERTAARSTLASSSRRHGRRECRAAHATEQTACTHTAMGPRWCRCLPAGRR